MSQCRCRELKHLCPSCSAALSQWEEGLGGMIFGCLFVVGIAAFGIAKLMGWV